jgi:acyl-CoA thioester hydrolase
MEIETCRTVVYPWLCDFNRHFATQNYMAVFDDATAHLLGHLGYLPRDIPRTNLGFADVRHEISYKKELLAGDLLLTKSSVVRVGTKSFTYRHRLIRLGDDEAESAEMIGVAVHFDLKRRVAIELPADFRANWERLMCSA